MELADRSSQWRSDMTLAWRTIDVETNRIDAAIFAQVVLILFSRYLSIILLCRHANLPTIPYLMPLSLRSRISPNVRLEWRASHLILHHYGQAVDRCAQTVNLPACSVIIKIIHSSLLHRSILLPIRKKLVISERSCHRRSVYRHTL